MPIQAMIKKEKYGKDRRSVSYYYSVSNLICKEEKTKKQLFKESIFYYI